MKIIKEENAEKFNYADTSSVLEYGIALNEKKIWISVLIKLMGDTLWRDIAQI